MTMCDYDYDYTELSSKWVKTRKPHRCASCQRKYQSGARMHYSVGRSEGEFCDSYGCEACMFGLHQPEHGDLHLCWNWSYDEWDEYQAAYNYIRSCFDRGVEPTIFGVMAERAAMRQAQENDDEVAA